MFNKAVLICLLLFVSTVSFAERKPPVQIVQLLDLVGITSDEADQFLQKQIMNLGYSVIPMTEKPNEYYVLYILNSNVAAGSAVATGLSAVIAKYEDKHEKEYLIDHSTTVILITGQDMESAKRQGMNALRGIVEGLDKALQAQ